MSDTTDYHPLYLGGIQHFNACDFYEAHEVWEALWTEYRGPARLFYQGLIQAAVGLHHFGNGNIRGARKLYHSVCKYLEPYGAEYQGLNLEQFLQQFQTCFAEILASTEEFPEIEIVPDLIPEIHLNPAPTAEQLASAVTEIEGHHD
jgi:uncharacterized protein